MGIKLDDGTMVKLGRSRELMDLTAPVDRIIEEIARWDVDPRIDANNLFDGQIYNVSCLPVSHNGLGAPSALEVLWLPRTGNGAIHCNGETAWAAAENPEALLESWALANMGCGGFGPEHPETTY